MLRLELAAPDEVYGKVWAASVSTSAPSHITVFNYIEMWLAVLED